MKHIQHPLGHGKAACDVDGAEAEGDRTQNCHGRGNIRRNLQHAADDDDAADGVGDAHQGGVQGGGDIPDHLPAQEGGQHEHRKVGDEGFRRVEANGDTGGTEENPPENLADSAFLFLFYFRSSNGFRVYLLRLRCWGLRFWGRPDYLAIMDDGGGANHFIVKVDVEVFRNPPRSLSRW